MNKALQIYSSASLQVGESSRFDALPISTWSFFVITYSINFSATLTTLHIPKHSVEFHDTGSDASQHFATNLFSPSEILNSHLCKVTIAWFSISCSFKHQLVSLGCFGFLCMCMELLLLFHHISQHNSLNRH